MSEFGRTAKENGNRGTDHGHGSVYWVMGGGLNGGRIAGAQTKIDQPHLFENRDLPVLTDYRALFAGLVQRIYGLDAKLMAILRGSERQVADVAIERPADPNFKPNADQGRRLHNVAQGNSTPFSLFEQLFR
mgnify:CR=1 FL=1